MEQQPSEKGNLHLLLMFAAAMLIVVFLLIAITSKKPYAAKSAIKDSINTPIIDTSNKIAVKASEPESDSAIEANESEWQYSDSEDAMTDKKIHIAKVDAEEPLDLKPPYDGLNTASLNLRHGHGPLAVYIQVDRGQFLANTIENQTVKVRFDSGHAREYEVGCSNDGRTNIVFFFDPEGMIAHIKKAKETRIEVEFYDNGYHILTFATKNLKWP